MKRYIFILISIIAGTMQLAAQVPYWLSQRPVSEKEYIGIGMAKISEDDYMNKAKQNAFSEIASQIATKVDSKAFMHTLDVDGKSRELFEEKITNTMSAWIEGIEMIDTYKDKENYYVYCSLDKKLYKKNAEARRKEAIAKGYDYLAKGYKAEEEMNLTQAVLLYSKGLEAVEPWLFMDLSADIDGTSVNIPAELYNSYINIFADMTITTNVQEIEAKNFNNVNIPIAACLSKNGKTIQNVALKASFVTGKGDITPPIETDHNGTSEFYITNILSKEKIQEIRITIDDSFKSSVPESYQELLKKTGFPVARITVSLKAGATTAYIYADDQNDLSGIEDKISSFISKDYFRITEDYDNADCFIEISSSLDFGESLNRVRNLNTCYCSLTLKIYSNSTHELLLEYGIDRAKVYVEADKSAKEARSQCINEVMKRVKRDLPNKLDKMNM